MNNVHLVYVQYGYICSSGICQKTQSRNDSISYILHNLKFLLYSPLSNFWSQKHLRPSLGKVKFQVSNSKALNFKVVLLQSAIHLRFNKLSAVLKGIMHAVKKKKLKFSALCERW